jgi:DNA sulfur modification protein DndD
MFEELELIATADGYSRWHITQPDQFLLNLFPLGVSQLLFFDGERIKSFAESKDTNRLLRDGFFAMTGIDNVRKAWRDLTLYSTRLKDKETNDSKSRLHELDQEITKLRKKRDRIHERIGNISSEIKLAQGGVSEDEQRLAREGAEYASRRHELLRKEVLLDHGRSELKREISRLCDGLLPFAFAPSLVEQTVETLLKERETLAARNSAMTAKQIRLALEEEMKRKSFWKGCENNAPIQTIIKRTMDVFDEFSTTSRKEEQILHGFSEEKILKTVSQLDKAQSETPLELREAISKLRKVSDSLKDVRGEISRIPPDETLKPIVESLHASIAQLTKLDNEKMDLLNALEAIDGEITSKQAAQERELEEIGKEVQHERKLYYARKTLKVLREFETHLVDSRAQGLESNLLETLNVLRPKSKRIRKIKVSPDTFAASLTQGDGSTRDSSMLSSGEKQLYAIALLGAILKASNRAFPFLVDTPLARLDRKHRGSVVSHFLPTVSDQVILFATDTEITKSVHKLLAPHLAREFKLSFSGRTGTTSISQVSGGSS